MSYKPLLDQVIAPKNVSKYSLRMLKLRSKIFNEYIRPPMPFNITRAAMVNPHERQVWDSHHYQNEKIIQRFGQLPLDLDHIRSIRYYPAHPQMSDLMTKLRQHGLYRDEHKDIKEEMNRLRILRGKPSKLGWRKWNCKSD